MMIIDKNDFKLPTDPIYIKVRPYENIVRLQRKSHRFYGFDKYFRTI